MAVATMDLYNTGHTVACLCCVLTFSVRLAKTPRRSKMCGSDFLQYFSVISIGYICIIGLLDF
jgi:hypothetical protein